MSQVNIQFHEVVSLSWAPRKAADEPRVLIIHTLGGEQRLALFPARLPQADQPLPEDSTGPVAA